MRFHRLPKEKIEERAVDKSYEETKPPPDGEYLRLQCTFCNWYWLYDGETTTNGRSVDLLACLETGQVKPVQELPLVLEPPV